MYIVYRRGCQERLTELDPEEKVLVHCTYKTRILINLIAVRIWIKYHCLTMHIANKSYNKQSNIFRVFFYCNN